MLFRIRIFIYLYILILIVCLDVYLKKCMDGNQTEFDKVVKKSSRLTSSRCFFV